MANENKDNKFAGEKVLVWGSSGWIGGMLCDYLEKNGATVYKAKARLEEREKCGKELDEYNPDYVLCAAGITGRPNVDWCEDHKDIVLRVNIIGTLSLADLCQQRNIHMTLYATGCIYTYNDKFQPRSGVTVTEDEPPNFFGSFYSMTKGHGQALLNTYPNVLILRLRMPVSDDLNPRNFVTKITKYERVVNIPNSMTVLHELLPLSVDMARRKLSGTYNFVNPGAISHNEVLDLYKEIIDPNFNYTNFTEEEQNRILKAQRSNTELSTEKLQAANPNHEIEHISVAFRKVFERMKENLANNRLMTIN